MTILLYGIRPKFYCYCICFLQRYPKGFSLNGLFPTEILKKNGPAVSLKESKSGPFLSKKMHVSDLDFSSPVVAHLSIPLDLIEMYVKLIVVDFYQNPGYRNLRN